jgi:hypothetical protein
MQPEAALEPFLVGREPRILDCGVRRRTFGPMMVCAARSVIGLEGRIARNTTGKCRNREADSIRLLKPLHHADRSDSGRVVS